MPPSTPSDAILILRFRPVVNESMITTTVVIIRPGCREREGLGGHRMATDYVSEWMTDELRDLRDVARQFFEREAAPRMAKWSEQRFVDREFWVEAGRIGLLCPTVPEEYGGPGGNILHQVAITEEQSRVLEKGWGNNVHSGVVTDYLLRYGSKEQCQRWLPPMVEGTVIGAIAITETGAGFPALMNQMPQERLILAVNAVVQTEKAVRLTLAYSKERKVFGKPLYDQQNTRFVLAECATLARAARLFIDHCIVAHAQGRLDNTTAAMAKWWLTDVQCKVLDECVQLFGGYGYMEEYPIARMYADSRVQKIYGGANEIMKEIIARAL